MQSLTDTNGTRYVDNTAIFGAAPAVIATVIAGPIGLGIWGLAMTAAYGAELVNRKYDTTAR